MGQATSSNTKSLFAKNPINNTYEDISDRFAKVTISTLAVPMIIVAYPILNAYTFQNDPEITGVRVLDGAIGGLLGVIGWPISPILAIWNAVQINFKESSLLPLSISPDVLQRAEEEIQLDAKRFYNVAIVGVSGSGKSSIVNAIRGYKDTDRHAAKVGEVETTMVPKGYLHPDLDTLMIWDMPGLSTPTHSFENYFEKNHLAAFDLLVIVMGNRVMEDDIKLATKAKQHKIPVLFVRSKSDKDIDSKRKRNESQNEIAEWAELSGILVDEVKHSTFKTLRAAHLNTKKFFIVSSCALQQFVATINQKEVRDKILLIDEERFMRALVEGVFVKRKQMSKLNKNK